MLKVRAFLHTLFYLIFCPNRFFSLRFWLRITFVIESVDVEIFFVIKFIKFLIKSSCKFKNFLVFYNRDLSEAQFHWFTIDFYKVPIIWNLSPQKSVSFSQRVCNLKFIIYLFLFNYLNIYFFKNNLFSHIQHTFIYIHIILYLTQKL